MQNTNIPVGKDAANYFRYAINYFGYHDSGQNEAQL